jgi:hypothetical protein
MNSLIFGGQMTVETVPASLEPLRNGGYQTVREIVFQFDIGVVTTHTFKKGKQLYMKSGWLGTKDASF